MLEDSGRLESDPFEIGYAALRFRLYANSPYRQPYSASDAALLYESPFTDLTPRGPDDLFTSAQVDELIGVLARVRPQEVPGGLGKAHGEGVHAQHHRDEPREQHHLDPERQEPASEAQQIGRKNGSGGGHEAVLNAG